MLSKLDEYKEKYIGSPDEYFDIPGREVRLAVLKFNDLYYTIAEARIELSYVKKEYYEDMEKENGIDFVRYLHLKNAIQDLNRIFDIGLQIPWFLYRIWSDKDIFNRNEEKDQDTAGKILKNNDDWINSAEELCKYKYVKRYLSKIDDTQSNHLLELLKKFNDTFIFNKEGRETVRSLCNYIKHKGNIQPKELNQTTKLNISLNNEQLKEGIIILTPKKYTISGEDNIFNNLTPPDIKLNIANNTIDFIYSKGQYPNGEVFYGKDIVKDNLSIDTIYKECINYLIAFKPIYYCYIDMLNKYLCSIMKSPSIRKTSEIKLNNLYQQK